MHLSARHKTQRDCLRVWDRLGARSELGCTDYLRSAIVFQRLIPQAFGLRFLPLIYGERGIDKSPAASHQSRNDKARKASLHVRQTAGPQQEARRKYLYPSRGWSRRRRDSRARRRANASACRTTRASTLRREIYIVGLIVLGSH